MSDSLHELEPDHDPHDPSHRAFPLGGAVIGLGALALVIWLAIGARRAAGTGPSAPTLPTAPAAPPCIHEVCVDRPARMRCVRPGSVPARCDEYAFEYEHHCTCDTWGSTPVDGGAP